MPIPANIKAVTVTARYVKADGSPASGLVRFALSAPAAVPVDKAMVPLISVKATLDAAGSISVVLAASDDPDWASDGLTYQVTERITGAELRTYNVTIPAAAPAGTVDLASLAPAVPGPALVAYVLAAAVGAPTGVASLDAAGQVPLSQLGNAPGGADAVASVNGQTGAVMLDAADVGADPAGAAGSQVAAHVAAVDPHGDRAHVDEVVDALDQATTTALAGKADASHIHAAGDITSGTFAIGRLPVGTAADKVAAGDHTHPGGASVPLGLTVDAAMFGLSLISATVENANQIFALNAGVLGFVLVRATAPDTLSHLGAVLGAQNGITPTGVNGLAIYSAAGVLLGRTGDMSAQMASGTHVWIEDALQAGVDITADTNYWLAVLTHFTTAPSLRSAGSGSVNLVPINGVRSSVFLTAQADFPANFDPATAQLNSAKYLLTAR